MCPQIVRNQVSPIERGVCVFPQRIVGILRIFTRKRSCLYFARAVVVFYVPEAINVFDQNICVHVEIEKKQFSA